MLTDKYPALKIVRYFSWCKNLNMISCSIIILIIIAFSLTLHRAIWLGMDVNPGYCAGEAIPGAISKIAFDNKKKYTTNQVVTDEYKKALASSGNINFAIQTALQLSKTTVGNETYILFGNDDKGILDFVTMSFQIFGLKVQSILYFYFFVLFISSGIFIHSFFRYPMRLLFILQFWIMLFLILPMVKFNGQLISVLMPRAMPVLAIISALHLLLFAFSPKFKIAELFKIAFQVAIVIFVLHIRSTTYWLIYIVGIVCLGNVVFNLYREHLSNTITFKFVKNLFTLLPLVFLIVGYLGLQEYRNLTFAKDFSSMNQLVTRTIWHNIYSGFAFDPELSERYKLRIDDLSIFDAVGQYLVEKGREAEWVSMGGTSQNYGGLHWNRYDEMVKEMLFSRCSSYPLNCFRTIFYYKPMSLIRHLGWLYGVQYLPPDMDLYVSRYFGDPVKQQIISATQQMDQGNLRANMWAPISILLLLPFIFLIRFPFDRVAILSLSMLSIGSLIPSVLGYPAPHTIADTSIIVGMLIYSLVAIMFSKIYNYLGSMRHTRAVSLQNLANF